MTQLPSLPPIEPTMLVGLFAATIQPEETARKQAESHLKELTGSAGFGPSLLSIVMAPLDGADPMSLAIHQAAAVYFKNFVEKHWETYEESVPSLISEQDKATVRNAIVDAVVGSKDAIRKQLLTVVRRLVRSDFPKLWGGLLDGIGGLLHSNDINQISAGLGVFQEVVAWRGHGQKELDDVIQGQVFPILLQIGSHFATHDIASNHSIVKAVLKAYFSAIQFKFSHWLMSGDVFVAWFDLCVKAIQAPPPADVMGLGAAEAKDHGFWKMKKWAFHIQNKIMSRYGNPKLNTYTNPDAPEFAKAYMANMAVPALQVYLGQIQSMLEGRNPLTDRIVCIICDFFEASIRHTKTWTVLQPRIMELVEYFVFPRLCWSAADQELWEGDEHEFVRSKLDPFDDFYSASASCINFIVDLVKNKKKTTFLPILGFLNGVLTHAQSKPNDASEQSRKDGAIYLVGSLASVLLDSKVASQMESFMAAFVIPELTSPTAHLRFRACWAVEQFDQLTYESEATGIAVLSGVLSCMQDREFPVKVASCSALAGILENEFVKKALPPYLPKVVETILALANEIELDSLSYVLEDLVGMFSEEMAPYAAQLCLQLRETLMKSLASYEGNANEEDNGFFDDTDKMMAVIGMLGTINTLLDSMAGKSEAMVQLEAILVPLIHHILTHQIMDIYEEVFSLLDSITYARKTISPALWQLLEPIHRVFLDVGSSYIADMSTTLDNYISYGSAELLTTYRPGLEMIVDMVRVIMTDDDYVESDHIHGCQLMESLMLNCRGQIDQYVPGFIGLAVAKFAGEGIHAISHRVCHLEVVLNALYYNSAMALQELERLNATALIFAKWFEIHPKFTRVHDKRLVILALGSLIQTLPYAQLPASLQANWHMIMPVLLEAVQTLPKAMDERKRLQEAEERSDAEDDDDDDEGLSYGYGSRRRQAPGATDDEDYLDEDEASDNGIRRSTGEDFEAYNPEGEEDDDDDWEDDDVLEEELYFETPIDNLNFADLVQGSVRAVASQNPASFAHLTQALTPEQQATLRTLLGQ